MNKTTQEHLDTLRGYLAGFEDDETQEGIAELLATVDAVKIERAAMLAALKIAAEQMAELQNVIGATPVSPGLMGKLARKDWAIRAREELNAADKARASIRAAIAKAEAGEFKPARVVITCDGGLVQSVISDVALAVTVIDYDVEGADAEDVTQVKQDDGTTEGAHVVGWPCEVNSGAIDRLTKEGAQ